MYAIIETGSKQYKVSKGDVLEVERFNAKKGEDVELDKVLLVSDKDEVSVGKPYIKGASVICEVIGEKRAPKVISFKYRRKHASSKKKIGHRQNYTVLRVKEIKTS